MIIECLSVKTFIKVNTAPMVTDEDILTQLQQQSDNEDNEDEDVETVQDEQLQCSS